MKSLGQERGNILSPAEAAYDRPHMAGPFAASVVAQAKPALGNLPLKGPDTLNGRDTPARLGYSASSARPSIEVHIEEIVLQGFPPAQRHSIADGIERELARLLSRNDAPPHWSAGCAEMDELDAGSFTVEYGRKPLAVGSDIARAIYRGLSR
jgi:hypothetical protein